MVQMFKNGKYKNAKVYIRVMPSERMSWDYVKVLNDKKTIYVRALQDFEKGYENRVPHYWNFSTDGVLYNLTQQDIYETIVNADFLNEVLEGNDAIILAYGQTGSGKSLTINGMHCPYEERGIAPRLISHLFSIKNNEATKMVINMSYIETKKFYAVDLLNDEDNLLDTITIKNVTSIRVNNENHALRTLFRAEGRRDISECNKYPSNNANGVLTFEISRYDKIRGKKKSKIHLVDLAGADTSGNISCFFKNILEVGQANLAKTQLEQFILILCENIYERIVVKQRLNILIAYLKHSLNTNSLLRFVGNIRTDIDNLKLTLSVLRFSQIVLGLKFAKPLPDVEPSAEKLPEVVEKQLDRMKTARLLEQMFNGNDTSLSTNIDQERAYHIKNFMHDYLKDNINVIVPLTLGEVSTVLEVFKNQYRKMKEECNDAYQNAYNKAFADITSEKTKREQRAKTSSMSLKRERSRQSVSTTTKTKNVESTASYTTERDHHSVTSYRKQSSAKNIKRLSSGKRRSQTSETICEVISQDQQANIPEFIPTYDDAWTLFSINVDHDYEKLMEIIRTAEEDVKKMHKHYLTEVDNLRLVNDVFQIRRNELHKIDFCKDLKRPVESAIEEGSKTRFEEARKDILQQQEQVLKWQTELRIVLNSLQEAKSNLNKEFDLFCMEKYKTYIPKIEIVQMISTMTHELEDKQLTKTEDDKKPVICTDKIALINAYVELQNLMRKEANQKKMRCKHKKWINAIKIR